MSVEVGIAIFIASGSLIVTCFTIGIGYGVMKGKVDTCQRDVNNAFRMIREVKNKLEE